MRLYTEQDIKATQKGVRVRALIFTAMLALVVVAVGLLSSVWRNRVALIAAAAVGGSLCYAYGALKLMPWVRYWRYNKDMREGLSRETEAWFVSCDDGTRFSDGVEVHEFIVRVGDKEEDERLFFWDADKERPQLKAGQRVRILSFGNYIKELDLV